MKEIWKDILGCEGRYQVSDQGRIRSLAREITVRLHKTKRTIPGLIRKLSWQGPPKSQYLGCLVTDNNGKTRIIKAHIEVLRSFVGERPGPEYDACHGDSDRSNNTLSNLRWDTKSGNNADKVIAGTAQVGERNPSAKLTDKQVILLRSQRTETLKALSEQYGISMAAVSKIRRGETYKHIKEMKS